MTAVVFETPGLIDVRAFTIMGAHAKPNSPNPIGFFGTGLKYAIAVLVRLGAEPVVWIGRDKFTFYSVVEKFRGSDLNVIRMRVKKDGARNSRVYELPYTTAYGKNWKVWQAFRELESNTRDEGGKTYLLDADLTKAPGFAEYYALPDRTLIVVDLPEFAEEAEKIDSIFLPRARREGTLLEAIFPDDLGDREFEKLAFYRTMRAKELGKPSLFTYNFLEAMTLTEDRQLAYEFQMRDVLARWVLSEATEAQVEAIVTADEEWWEHGLEFPARVPPSEAFRAVMARRPKGLSRYAHSYYGAYSGGSTRRGRSGFSLFSYHPKPWKLDGDLVVDGNGDPVFERPDDGDAETWEAVAFAIIRRLDVLPLPGAPAIIDVPPSDPPPVLEVVLVPRLPAPEIDRPVPVDEGMPF